MSEDGHVYNTDFYNYIEKGSRASARIFIGLLRAEFEFDSILDVGCGRGAWLSEWQNAGYEDLVGVDGAYVVREDFHISAERSFSAHDLTKPFDLGRQFGLAQCLEVAEHLPKAASVTLVESLVRHADIIVFSAAQKGQGGEAHINEQPIEYWRQIFGEFGFEPYDFLRPRLKEKAEVMPWYKYNAVIYANPDGATRLSESIRASKPAANERLKSGGSIGWRFRRAIVGLMPRAMVDMIAKLNAKRVSSSRA